MRKGIVFYLLLSAALLLPLAGQAQESDSANYITALGDKQQATCGDALTIFMFQLGKKPGNYTSNQETLRKEGIEVTDRAEGESLRRGEIANMVAQHLKLSKSLFYNIFKTDRYAVKACVAAKIMTTDSSEWDLLSGEELIEIMRKAAEKEQGGSK